MRALDAPLAVKYPAVRALAVRDALKLDVPGALERRGVQEISMAERRAVDWPAGAQAREDSRAPQGAEDSNSVLGRALPQEQDAQPRLAFRLPVKLHAALPMLQSTA